MKLRDVLRVHGRRVISAAAVLLGSTFLFACPPTTTVTFKPSVDYYGMTSNNDGSLLIDRPYYDDKGDLLWLSAASSSLSGVCKHYGLGTYYSGVSFGDFDETAIIKSNGRFDGIDAYADNPGILLTICSDDQIHDDIYDTLPPIPTVAERSTDVFEDFPYLDEVTIYEPYILRSAIDLEDGEEFIPLGVEGSSPDGMCYYFGYGPAIEWEFDLLDWDMTAIVKESGRIETFEFPNSEYFNEGYYSITCSMVAASPTPVLGESASRKRPTEVLDRSKASREIRRSLAPPVASTVSASRKSSDGSTAESDRNNLESVQRSKRAKK